MSTPAAVITVSDRSAAGIRADAAGPIAVAALRDAGFDCAEPVVTPDGADAVQSALQAALAAGARLIVTTGGTGLSPIEYRQSVLEGRQASSDLFSERTGLKKKALRPKKKAVPHELQEERVRVELLNYKVRVPRHVD